MKEVLFLVGTGLFVYLSQYYKTYIEQKVIRKRIKILQRRYFNIWYSNSIDRINRSKRLQKIYFKIWYSKSIKRTQQIKKKYFSIWYNQVHCYQDIVWKRNDPYEINPLEALRSKGVFVNNLPETTGLVEGYKVYGPGIQKYLSNANCFRKQSYLIITKNSINKFVKKIAYLKLGITIEKVLYNDFRSANYFIPHVF